MAKGLISVDWILGLTIFTVFAAFGFVYYVGMAPGPTEPLLDATSLIADKVLDNILVDVYEMPLTYNSPGTEPNAVLYIDFTWPSNTLNSTQVLLDSAAQQCIIHGNRLYWQADLSTGVNTFKMRISDQPINLACTGTFDIPIGPNLRQVIPFSKETERMVSNASVNQMTATDYGTFKTTQGINRDFQVTLNASGTVTTYGASPLTASSIYVKEIWKRIEETDQPVNIIIKVW